MNHQNDSDDLDSHEDYMKPLAKSKKIKQCIFTQTATCPDKTNSRDCLNCSRYQKTPMTFVDRIVVFFLFFLILIFLIWLLTK